MKEKIHASSEDYLETILILSQKGESVRVSDIAAAMLVSKPSVHKAMHVLKDDLMIEQEHYGTIVLTNKGLAYAQNVYDRHLLIKRFFILCLHLEERDAEEEACRVEHCLSDHTITQLRAFLEEVLHPSSER